MIVRALPLTNNVALVIAVGSPYVAVAAAVTLVLSLIARQVALSLVAVVIVTANLAIQIPWYYFAKPVDVGAHVDIRVLSSNLRKGRADVPAFAELARTSADVMMLSELTPDWVRHFYSTGIRREFPYSLLVPAPDAGGFGMWSRFPLEVVSPLKGGNMIAARMEVPGVRVNPVVAGLHIMNPLTYYGRAFREWREGISAAGVRMNHLAEITDDGAVVVAGDFNSTPDMRQFRDLLANGYRDAVEQAGTGVAPTYPSYPWFPPLITIDHVLTRNATATSIRTVELRDSDHRALLATIEILQNPVVS
ncbi:endonuclease/exonuclease/phosphatase family protein [Mycolicibacterium sp. CR10]|uniref:endonuclease/exonuclease/phosphatase family protein n=1 Tax=Mycolicibacterium sp. CR10 TaxID=2562314 RepID=UPI001F10DF33|nr:endonuclease/exonuclease/phosphatase family protein [Mycolicibacterium sp. CR10]